MGLENILFSDVATPRSHPSHIASWCKRYRLWLLFGKWRFHIL